MEEKNMNKPYCVAEFLVTFSKEVSQKLGFDKNPAFRNSLANAIVNLRCYSFTAATQFFFCLYYGAKEEREKALFGLFQRKQNQSLEDFIFQHHLESIREFTLEHFKILANEMLDQYKEAYPKFLDVNVHSECQEEFDTLKAILAEHPVLLYKTVHLCEQVYTSADFVTPCVNFLLSEKDREQIEGLKMLGYTFSYRTQLRSYVTEIGLFLKAMNNAYEEEQRILKSHQDDGNFNTPFSQLSVLLKKMQEKTSNNDGPVESTTSQVVSQSTCDERADDNNQSINAHPADERPSMADITRNYPLSDELAKFLDNKYQIMQKVPRSEELWECLQALRKLGVDLNLLIDREDYLLPILNAHDDLEEAFIALQAANQQFNTAKANFPSTTDNGKTQGILSFAIAHPETIQNIVNSKKAVQDAQNRYDLAFNKFVKCCKAYEKAATTKN